MYFFRLLFPLFIIASLSADQKIEQVVVLGSGPAGLTAAIYTARAGLSTLVLEGNSPGGQLIFAYNVENFPGLPEAISGFQLQKQMQNQALRFGARIESGEVVALDLSKRPFTLFLQNGTPILTEMLIVATGTSSKPLGIESEEQFKGKGIAQCAFCDAILYEEKEVIIVGSSDMALDEALLLATYASKVTIINEGAYFNAAKAIQDLVFTNPKIELIWNSKIENILDPLLDKVTGVILRDILSNEASFYPCDGIFVAIGFRPNTSLFKELLELDDEGYILTKTATTVTNIPGVFAAGSVAADCYPQAITAAASGCMAGIDAYHFFKYNLNPKEEEP
jgi:thioredoxin reductase (NADPH)